MLGVLLLTSGTGNAKPVKTLEDGKTGAVEFESLTFPMSAGAVSDLMVGDESAKPVITSAKLRIPKGEGRLPAVILMHGCSGLNASHEFWVHELDRAGIATLLIDSFDGRRVTELCTARQRLSTLDLLVDAYRALALLATHPRIDPTRIAIMGFSLGGRTALWLSYARFRTRWSGPVGPQFAAYLAFYPATSWYKLLGEEEIGDRPIRIFQGSADDWTPAATIERYVNRLRAAGRDNISLIVYEGAYHGFDNPRGSLAPRPRPDVVNPSRCLFVEQPDGRYLDAETGHPLALDLPCLFRGSLAGYDPQAVTKALHDVKAFLQEVFGK